MHLKRPTHFGEFETEPKVSWGVVVRLKRPVGLSAIHWSGRCCAIWQVSTQVRTVGIRRGVQHQNDKHKSDASGSKPDPQPDSYAHCGELAPTCQLLSNKKLREAGPCVKRAAYAKSHFGEIRT